jgi:hypothetical protein
VDFHNCDDHTMLNRYSCAPTASPEFVAAVKNLHLYFLQPAMARTVCHNPTRCTTVKNYGQELANC